MCFYYPLLLLQIFAATNDFKISKNIYKIELMNCHWLRTQYFIVQPGIILKYRCLKPSREGVPRLLAKAEVQAEKLVH